MPSTMPSSLHCIASSRFRSSQTLAVLSDAAHYARTSALFLRKFEPHFAVTLGVLAPTLAHLHEQEQMHGSLDHGGDLTPGVGTDRLDGLPALAEHDLALAFALDIDRLLDPDRAVLALRPGIGLDGGLVGELLMQAQIELLARDLGRKLAQRRVRDLVLGIVPRPLGYVRGEPAFDVGNAVAGQRRGHEGRRECQALVDALGDREQGGFLYQVDLIDDENFGPG